MGRLIDYLTPQDDSVHFILKKNGQPVAAIYKKGETEEYRTPTPKHLQDSDAQTADND
jgi:hypothetical protein